MILAAHHQPPPRGGQWADATVGSVPGRLDRIVPARRGAMTTLPAPLGAIRCLSVRQPHAFLICAGIKPVENRTWSTKYRGPLLIHAGKAKETPGGRSFAFRALRHRFGMGDAEARRVYGRWAARGAVIGHAELYGCVRGPIEPAGQPLGGEADLGTDLSAWFSGPVGFLLRDTGFFAAPIPSRGRLSLYRPDGESMRTVADSEVLPSMEWRTRELGRAARPEHS